MATHRIKINCHYPWGAMAVGDEFVVPAMTELFTRQDLQGRVSGAASYAGQSLGRKFATHQTTKGSMIVTRVE